MSALVHLPNPTRIKLHLKPEPNTQFAVVATRSKFGVEFQALEKQDIQAELLSGKEAGSYVSKIGPNQRALLSLGLVTPYKYQAIVSVNPELNSVATVMHPGILEPKATHFMDLYITAHKEVDLNDYNWFCRVYLFE
jgi:hypothetical protein